MLVSEYAERILFGTTIEDKLIDPDAIRDDRAPALESVPALPGRPQALALDAKHRARVRFPKLTELEQDRAAGHVLHFFANHELLAMELMALVLLRFPDAPASFRRGVVGTLREEQKHMRLYKQRMEALGVEFGEIPVNRFFWDAIRDMKTPMDFVARMSLTFEQANLDYAGFYARAFREVDDSETADILDMVFDEEIAHVAHGMAWFRRWKDAALSEYEAYVQHLEDVFAPSRGRGAPFDRLARVKAGLSEDFIANIEICGGSKGRPPRVGYFNPTVELELERGTTHTAPRVLEDLARDLELLMASGLGRDDVLIVRERPPVEALQPLHHAGFAIPEFVIAGSREQTVEAVRARHLGELEPWGWTPALVELWSAWSDRLTRPSADLFAAATNATRVASKVVSARISDALHDGFVDGWVGDRQTCVPRVVGRLDEARRVAAELHTATGGTVVMKAEFGTSGRNALRTLDGTLDDEQTRWLAAIFARGQRAVLEPWVQRFLDLSAQLDIGTDGWVKVTAIQQFLTDGRGQYLGTVIGPTSAGHEDEIARFLHGGGRDPRRLTRTFTEIGKALAQEGVAGPVGIDAFLYRQDGQLRLRPLVEVNPRITMGRVAANVGARVYNGGAGLFLILRRSDVPGGKLDPWVKRMVQAYPLDVSDPASPRAVIRGGVLPLTWMRANSTHAAVLFVGPDYASCRQWIRDELPALDARLGQQVALG